MVLMRENVADSHYRNHSAEGGCLFVNEKMTAGIQDFFYHASRIFRLDTSGFKL